MSKAVSNFHALDATEPYDVCVVGAGIAGSVLALRFVRAGLRVLLVEAGNPTHGRGLTQPSIRAPGDVVGDARYPRRTLPRRGGGSWNGLCERFQPGDFAVHPYTRTSNPWPLSYDALEPHYRAAEETLRVRSGAGTRPDRSGVNAERPEPRLRRLGFPLDEISVATAARGRSPFSADAELLPEFLASPRGVLVTGITATRLRTDRNGRVVGVTCRAPDGASKIARADTYILAAGGIETPRLLLLSRSQRFPEGLGNDHGRVGRGFNDHAIIRATAAAGGSFPWFSRPRPVHTAQFHQTFRREGLGAIHPYFGCAGTLPASMPAETGAVARLVAALPPLSSAAAVSCRVEIKPDDGNRITLSRTSTDAFGDPASRLLFSLSGEDNELLAKARARVNRWLRRLGAGDVRDARLGWAGSAVGACRMGTDPRTSVCDATLRVHTSPNLFLCGAETFPAGGAAAPALTVAALAHRLADHVIARARWCARTTARPKRRHGKPAAPAEAIPLARRRPQH